MSKGIEGTGMSETEDAKKSVLAVVPDAIATNDAGGLTLCWQVRSSEVGQLAFGYLTEQAAWERCLTNPIVRERRAQDAASKLTTAPLPVPFDAYEGMIPPVHQSAPVGEREGEFENPEEVVSDLVESLRASWKKMEPGIDTCYTFEGHLGAEILKLRTALASKPSPAPEDGE